MFNQKNFSPVSANANSDSPKIWAYRTTDTTAQVIAENYFIAKINQLKTGEFIIVDSADGNFLASFDKAGSTITLNTDVNAFNTTNDINIERLLDGIATADEQDPTGLGPANAMQINFGPAVNDVTDPVMLDELGTVTVNESGLYRIKVALQYGRTGASGTSILLFRVRANDVQAGSSISTKLINSNLTQYFENDTWILLPAGTTLKYDVMRDSSGSNSGGLIGFNPTAAAGAEWNTAPSAAIRIERWV